MESSQAPGVASDPSTAAGAQQSAGPAAPSNEGKGKGRGKKLPAAQPVAKEVAAQQSVAPGVVSSPEPTGPVLLPSAERDAQGRLTRSGMEQVIQSGGSVLHTHVTPLEGGHARHQSRIISKIEELPSHADLAKGDKQLSDAARLKLMAERQRIDSELAKLD